jgi:hypothetical protein
MKNLSEKFDRLPQDFDPELIWEGIEKPGRQPDGRRYFFWVGLLLIATTALICFFSRQTKTAQEPAAIAGIENANNNPTVVHVDANRGTSTPPVAHQEDRTGALPTANRHANMANKLEKNAGSLEMSTSHAYPAVETVTSKTLDPIDGLQQHNPENPPADQNTTVTESLPVLTCTVDFNKEKPVWYANPNIVVIQKERKQSLALSLDIGRHQSRFDAPSDENAALRSLLEMPQLDYGLGLRYEYLFRRNFFLSASANYHLYKDKINTAHVRQDLQVDYRLHNHYHVFAGQFELGKRFFQRHFFWDVQGGLGLKLHQIAEVDYFVSEDILADSTQIGHTYRSTPDLFFAAQAALGKQLGQKTFVRLGVQAAPGLKLSASGSDMTHQITPFRAFLEVGMRF